MNPLAERKSCQHKKAKIMKGKSVYVVTYNGGLIGVFAELCDAKECVIESKSYDYKGVKWEEVTVR